MKILFINFDFALIKQRIRGKFIKNLLTLSIGTTIAQLIPIIASPILTRIFSPNDFGIFATFTALMALLLVFYSGKYELSIILPKSHQEAINIVALCLVIITFFSVVFIIGTLFFGGKVANLFNLSNIKPWLWLVPIGALIASLYMVLNEWYIRKENFLGLSKNKISNTFGITSSSLIFGVLNINAGLIFGQIFGQIFSVISALKRIFRDDKHLYNYISIAKMKYLAVKYKDFAKYNIPGQFINTIAGQLPIFILTSRFGLYEAGLFAFTDRILGVPMNFIGNSFKDVFKQRAVIDFKEKGNCIEIYRKVIISLLSIAIVPFSLLFIFAPELFSFAFGLEWHQAGIYARVLCVMYLLSFISMPTGWIFVITEKQRHDFLWQVIFLLSTIVPLILGYLVNDATLAILYLGIGRSFSYVVQLFMTYKLSKGKGFK